MRRILTGLGEFAVAILLTAIAGGLGACLGLLQ
jgi:hypothetical protein